MADVQRRGRPLPPPPPRGPHGPPPQRIAPRPVPVDREKVLLFPFFLAWILCFWLRLHWFGYGLGCFWSEVACASAFWFFEAIVMLQTLARVLFRKDLIVYCCSTTTLRRKIICMCIYIVRIMCYFYDHGVRVSYCALRLIPHTCYLTPATCSTKAKTDERNHLVFFNLCPDLLTRDFITLNHFIGHTFKY